MNKKSLSERDICTKFITPALEAAGWDVATQIREEFRLTKGRIIVRGKLHTRAQHKRADYVLFYKVRDAVDRQAACGALMTAPRARSKPHDGRSGMALLD